MPPPDITPDDSLTGCADDQGDLGNAIKTIRAAPAGEKLKRLTSLFERAATHRAALEEILQIACIITGESTANSFTSEAVWDGGMTAERLLRCLKKGRYVK